MRLFVVLCWLLVAMPPSAVLAAEEPQAGLPERQAVIETLTGRHALTLEVTNSPASMAKGLMFRRDLPLGRGMLFDYGRNRDGVAFWMKNTLIPLDMVFVGADRMIRRVHRNAIPLDETPIEAGTSTRYVIEVIAGTADQWSIAPGDRLSFQDEP